ncbi:diguanylate cyclase (GGDEF)-like protein [Agrobacterium vitis]|nr:diguanylate cyclase (GGDEF)-like protein [Agrobacterium vitis]MBE1438835.1 diguanylate cyclase (GGDEF)-like protein [Agrobacterium vitis]
MSAAALLQGLTWGLLPVAFIKMDLLGQDAPIMLILIGLAGTALLRQSFTSQTAFSYSIPIVLACAWCFMQRGGLVALVSTVDLLLMAGFLLFLMTKAEQRFIEGELAKLTSDHATKSLLRANEDIRQSNIRLEVLANCDPVTGLFNRTYLGGNIAGALAAATVSNRQVALVLFDIDRFKRINDTFGHCGGDQFLTILGQRLRAEAGANAIVARISGDEFAALITAGDVRQQSAALLKTMVECDLAPVTINGTAISPGLSAGLAFFPANGEDADELFNAASMALSEAKLAGRKQWREFDLQFKQAINRQRQIEQDLKEAITNNDITTWFQPQINLELGTVVSFEALVRWLHPVFGAISPPEIINAAHAMNLSETLTRRLANNVCSMLKELPAHGFPDAVVALNVSPREFALYNVAKMLDDITAEHGVQRNLLEIELTEESILDPETAGEQLLQMEINGYRLAVDDFGMGYSSLAYLISLKIDRLKIDRSIITDISESGANQALVTAMVGLGRALHVEIVVEGVETVDDANTLTSIGCDIAQGFYFARPMPSDVLFHWLEQNTRKNLNNNLQLASA